MSYLCSICGSGDHSASRCKELALPPDGFYKTAPASASSINNEDEDVISLVLQTQQTQQTHNKNYNKNIQIITSKYNIPINL